MLDPISLFRYEPSIDQRTIHDRVLVVTLGSYGDAGATQSQLDEHLLNTLSHRKLGSFDVDQIMDYRGHRPTIDFDQDHFENYVPPEMVLHEVTDKQGNPFLLLTGPEPALQWERVSSSIERIIDELDVQLVVTAQGIPMPVPHTRPISLMKVATRPDLLPGNQGSGSFRMSSSFLSMMTQRLGEAGQDVIGLVARVPQYLAENDFPDGAISLVRGLNQIAGLDVPLGDLEQSSTITRAQIDAQVSQSEQLQQMIAAMEEQYDRYMAERSLPMSEQDLPDADEIGRAVEDFLAGLQSDPNAQGDQGLRGLDAEDLGGPHEPGTEDGLGLVIDDQDLDQDSAGSNDAPQAGDDPQASQDPQLGDDSSDNNPDDDQNTDGHDNGPEGGSPTPLA